MTHNFESTVLLNRSMYDEINRLIALGDISHLSEEDKLRLGVSDDASIFLFRAVFSGNDVWADVYLYSDKHGYDINIDTVMCGVLWTEHVERMNHTIVLEYTLDEEDYIFRITVNVADD